VRRILVGFGADEESRAEVSASGFAGRREEAER